tara:strand:+ start:158 stop:700 length:543 start_codon:yes stop_codon:yes gene_type:complete
MKIELKKLQYSEFASHETHCFQADIWVDGKKTLFAENDGRGGPNYYANACPDSHRPNAEILLLIDKIVAEKKGDLKSQYGHWVDECDNSTLMDTLISLMIERKFNEKDLKKDLRKYILFTNEAGELMQAKPRTRKVTPEEIDLFFCHMADNGQRYITVLNEMPFEEAYEIVFPTTRVEAE